MATTIVNLSITAVAAAEVPSQLQIEADLTAPGTWREFSPSNMAEKTFYDPWAVPPLGESSPGSFVRAGELTVFFDSPGHISTDWFGRAVHDRVTKKVMWTGMGSGGTRSETWRVNHQVIYDERTNLLSTKRAVWGPAGKHSSSHQYAQNLINEKGREHYRRVSGYAEPASNQGAWHRYNLDTGVWSATVIPSANNQSMACGADFWPQLGPLGSITEMTEHGKLRRFDIATSVWSDHTAAAFNTWVMFLQPNADAGKGVMVGLRTSAPYQTFGVRLDGTIVLYGNAPVTSPPEYGAASPSKMLADPLSSKMLFFNYKDKRIYELDTDIPGAAWVDKSAFPPALTAVFPYACPCYLPAYGVLWFLLPSTTPANNKGLIYKHG